ALGGTPAPKAACFAGFWPAPACRTCPIMTASTNDASTPPFSKAPRIASAPSSVAAKLESPPRSFPNGVLAAPTMTMSDYSIDTPLRVLRSKPIVRYRNQSYTFTMVHVTLFQFMTQNFQRRDFCHIVDWPVC